MIVKSIEDESLSELGLQKGDRIYLFNKQLLTSKKQALELLTSTSAETSVELVIIIQGRKMKIQNLIYYASPFRQFQNNLHDEQSFES